MKTVILSLLRKKDESQMIDQEKERFEAENRKLKNENQAIQEKNLRLRTINKYTKKLDALVDERIEREKQDKPKKSPKR
ncbi:hypothetical protein [uncultured Fructobacillus sp.]|uniref:hypothetical protein n=1 Tax=uncultured Fructobacillus sp. TaxID=591942 RepID=UPI00259AB602|nr:hypothetical protein [uncultured Fructobacillus sp.]